MTIWVWEQRGAPQHRLAAAREDVRARPLDEVAFDVTAADPGGDDITYAADGLPEGASFEPVCASLGACDSASSVVPPRGDVVPPQAPKGRAVRCRATPRCRRRAACR